MKCLLRSGGKRVSRGERSLAGLDLGSAVAARGPNETFDVPAGVSLDPAGHGQRREHDVRLDGGALSVVDQLGLQPRGQLSVEIRRAGEGTAAHEGSF